MITIVNVLWGDWPRTKSIQKQYFKIFIKRLRECTTLPYNHVLYTDDVESYKGLGITVRPLGSVFPFMMKHTAKVVPYRYDACLEGQVFLIDVDFILKGNIDDILSYRGNYAICREYHPAKHDRVGGGIISFPANTKQFLYDFVIQNYLQYIFVTRGDERFFIEYMMKCELLKVDFFQELFPDKILSWKFEYKPTPSEEDKKYKRETASMIACHGVPRPLELVEQDKYFKEFWNLKMIGGG